MFIFRNIWRALFSCYLRFEIRLFALSPMNYLLLSLKYYQDQRLFLTYHFVKGCLESSNTWVYFLNHVISWATSSQNFSGCSMLFWNVCWYRQREHDEITIFDFLLWTSLIIFLKLCKNFFGNILLTKMKHIGN